MYFITKTGGGQVVVHGDDFTALGNDRGLDLYEAAMGKAFEIKLKGRLGNDEHDAKDMRVLNRILRATSKGLLYEPDPRHIEILAQSPGVPPNCNKPVTPGNKPKNIPEDLVPGESIDEIINCIRALPGAHSKVTVSEDISAHCVSSYVDTFAGPFNEHPNTVFLTCLCICRVVSPSLFKEHTGRIHVLAWTPPPWQ